MRRRAWWNLSCSRANIPGNWRHKRVSGWADPSCGFVYTHKRPYVYTCAMYMYAERWKGFPFPPSAPLPLRSCFYIQLFPSSVCLHQEGKKKLIPDPFTTRTQGNSSIVQKGGTRYANCVLPIQLRFANGLDPVNISFIISKAQNKYRFYIGNGLFHKFMFIRCADFAFAINVWCNKKESSVR